MGVYGQDKHNIGSIDLVDYRTNCTVTYMVLVGHGKVSNCTAMPEQECLPSVIIPVSH